MCLDCCETFRLHVLLSLEETGKSMIHDLQSEVSGDYGKALLILAEVRNLNGFTLIINSSDCYK